MSRILAAIATSIFIVAGVGCESMKPGGGSSSSYKPDKCISTQFTGDLADCKEGRSMTYASEAGGAKSTTTVKIVGKQGDSFWIEWWTESGSIAYGYLWVVGSDKKITKAWAAAKGDKKWTEIKVEEPPKAGDGKAGSDGEKPKITESDDDKEVKAGKFKCHRTDVTMKVQGKEFKTVSWYSKDVWKLCMGTEYGGVVANESSASKMWLDSKAEDAKPTIELPK